MSRRRKPFDPDALAARLAAVVANPPRPGPGPGPLGELHRRAVLMLAGNDRRGERVFTAAEARVCLDVAAEGLAHPEAPDVGPQPDPADVAAFLRALQAEEMARKTAGGWILDCAAVPF